MLLKNILLASSAILILKTSFVSAMINEEDDQNRPVINNLRGYPSLENVDFDTGERLFQSPNPSLKKIGRQIIKLIAQQDGHTKQYDSISVLLRSPKDHDKEFSKEILFKTLLSPQHRNINRAANQLFQFTAGEDKLIGARALVRNAAPLQLDDATTFNAAMLLLERDYRGNYIRSVEDITLALPVCRYFAQQRNDNQYNAAIALFRHDNRETFGQINQENYAIAIDALRTIARLREIPIHGDMFRAANNLLDTGDEEDREIALDSYRFLIQNEREENKFPPSQKLFRFGNQQDKELCLSVFNSFVRGLLNKGPYREYVPGFGEGYQYRQGVDNIDLADILLSTENESYKRTAYRYYERFINSYINEGKIRIYINLLKKGEAGGRTYARQNLSNDPDIIFTEGSNEDKATVRDTLRNNVLLGGQHTVKGPKAAIALFRHGSEDDKQYVRDQAAASNKWAQQAIQ